MGRYKYSESEKETNKVLKMQDDQLTSLKEKTDADTDDLKQLRTKIEAKLKAKGVNVPISLYAEEDNIGHIKIKKVDIPQWEDLVNEANLKYVEDIELEDLLSKEEFQFCIEDVQRINDEFSKKTGIFNKKDIAFISIAPALQTARWLIIQEICGDLGEKAADNSRLNHNDKSIKDSIKSSNNSFQNFFENHGHKESANKYKSWEQIIISSAPYDTAVESALFGENLEGAYHRYKTLGHDPILGWIFGTANFITDTCTLSNFHSYRISRIVVPHFSEPTNLGTIFYETFDSIMEDWLRLPAGIFAQFVHLKSDFFTKLGLPVPIIETFSESLAGDLYKSQYDTLCLLRDIAIVGNQAAWSILINMVIGLIHGLFYTPSDGDRKLYEVRTRKILSISNALASSGNIAYAIASEDWRKLDAGGILVTLYRLFSDTRFMLRIKKDFIESKMDEVLQKEIRELDAYFE